MQTAPQPGIYPDITNEAYHAGPGTSKTDLKFILRSPLTYRGIKTGEIQKKETIFKDLGKALHELVLEPETFNKTYCKPLTLEACERQGIKVLDSSEKIQAMVNDLNQIKRAEFVEQGIITSPETLVEMLNEMNKERVPKLSTSGTKPVLTDLIINNWDERLGEKPDSEALSALKGPELKTIVERLNGFRDGLLSTSGSRDDLAERLRDNGASIACGWEVEKMQMEATGRPYFLGSGKTKAEMIDWLNAEGYKGGGWRSWEMVKQEWAENNPDRIVLSEDEWNKVHGMLTALMQNKWASKLLWPEKGGKAEQTIYWVDEETGELCKVRPDFLRYDIIPVDLKSCNDATPEGFAKSVEAYGYDMQEQFYLDGIEAVTGKRPANMPFVVVEPEPPHLVAVYILDDSYKAIGKGLVRRALQTLKECRDKNEWPGLPEEISTLSPRRFYEIKHTEFLSWE